MWKRTYPHKGRFEVAAKLGKQDNRGSQEKQAENKGVQQDDWRKSLTREVKHRVKTIKWMKTRMSNPCKRGLRFFWWNIRGLGENGHNKTIEGFDL